jgi:probable HAF family extracellular repeat protein
VNHAFVYRDGTLFDLNDRLVANPGWTVLSGATDINDAGQIVGWGTIGGETHGFRLDPVVPTD